jgi:conjugative transposon TraN protein
MRKMYWMLLLTIGAGIIAKAASAQGPRMVKAMSLAVSDTKTTNLIFPYAVVSVDRGSKDVLVQKARNVENVLQVKVAADTFAGSNLTVITADGNLYSFNLDYVARPATLNWRLEVAELSHPLVQFSDAAGNKGRIGQMADRVAVRKPAIKHSKASGYDMEMALQGVYVHEDLLYFQLYLENNSALNYDVDQLRFFIEDKKQAKRTASQEQTLQPVYVAGNDKRIPGNSGQTLVVVIPKFTIPDKKLMIIQLSEVNGGRHLQLKVKYKTLAGALKVK